MNTFTEVYVKDETLKKVFDYKKETGRYSTENALGCIIEEYFNMKENENKSRNKSIDDELLKMTIRGEETVEKYKQFKKSHGFSTNKQTISVIIQEYFRFLDIFSVKET